MTPTSFPPARDAVFLFDVDGTLLQAGFKEHNQALVSAVRRVCGAEPVVDGMPLAGRTDTEILADMAALVGCAASPDVLAALFQAAVEEFERRCPANLESCVLHHVRPTLERLAAYGSRIGLLTGNIQSIAWRKMTNAGLRQFFGFGAFGDESHNRADLPPLALQRAGPEFDAARAYVIGDTPRDVACGAACGLKTVAVATGRYTLAELRACRPTFACAHLAEFMEALAEGLL